MGLKTRYKQSDIVPVGSANMNICHYLYCTVVQLWRPFIMQRSTAALSIVSNGHYSMQCSINSCFTQFCWGEIQCSPVSYRDFCWWYHSPIFCCQYVSIQCHNLTRDPERERENQIKESTEIYNNEFFSYRLCRTSVHSLVTSCSASVRWRVNAHTTHV